MCTAGPVRRRRSGDERPTPLPLRRDGNSRRRLVHRRYLQPSHPQGGDRRDDQYGGGRRDHMVSRPVYRNGGLRRWRSGDERQSELATQLGGDRRRQHHLHCGYGRQSGPGRGRGHRDHQHRGGPGKARLGGRRRSGDGGQDHSARRSGSSRGRRLVLQWPRDPSGTGREASPGSSDAANSYAAPSPSSASAARASASASASAAAASRAADGRLDVGRGVRGRPVYGSERGRGIVRGHKFRYRDHQDLGLRRRPFVAP